MPTICYQTSLSMSCVQWFCWLVFGDNEQLFFFDKFLITFTIHASKHANILWNSIKNGQGLKKLTFWLMLCQYYRPLSYSLASLLTSKRTSSKTNKYQRDWVTWIQMIQISSLTIFTANQANWRMIYNKPTPSHELQILQLIAGLFYSAKSYLLFLRLSR